MSIRIFIDDDSLSTEIIEKLLSIPHRLHHISLQNDTILEKLELILEKEDKIMAEIDDLQAALDGQSTAIGTFTTTLDSAVAAIVHEMEQLAAAVQSATDLAALKAAVGAVVPRVTGFTDSVTAASATLQAQVDALASDD